MDFTATGRKRVFMDILSVLLIVWEQTGCYKEFNPIGEKRSRKPLWVFLAAYVRTGKGVKS